LQKVRLEHKALLLVEVTGHCKRFHEIISWLFEDDCQYLKYCLPLNK